MGLIVKVPLMSTHLTQNPTPAKVFDFVQTLLEERLISSEQLAIARKEQRAGGDTIESCLLKLGFITEHALATYIAKHSGHEKITLHNTALDPYLIAKIPQNIAQKYQVIPVALNENHLTLAMTDVYNVIAIDAVRNHFQTDITIHPLIANQSEMDTTLNAYYNHDMTLEQVFQELETQRDNTLPQDTSLKSPITRLVNLILLEAINKSASDIHFQPSESFIRLKFRIDGVLEQRTVFHSDYWPKICVRLKIMGKMNIAESRKPQTGRFTYHAGLREVDFRVSAHPTLQGENIVLRILDKKNSLLPLNQLGFSSSNMDRLKQLANQPQGLIILTGPTGTGKTTTLYSILQYLNTAQRNIMTLEDPIEYQLPSIRQSTINQMGGTTFAQGIRSLLRQDPDIIFVGEIRDEDTATMALRAVMTGHQVLTTLHTQDSFGVIPRLADLGITPQNLAGYLTGVVSQRLIRLLCQSCKAERPATQHEQKILKLCPDQKLFDAKGCDECRHTRFKGRIAITEVLHFTEALNDLLVKNAPLPKLREEARKSGFQTLSQEGIQKILAGKTTLEELTRIVGIVQTTEAINAKI